MKLDDETKQRIKDERLLEYSRRIYILELDIAALDAVGDNQGADLHRKSLENLQKAYQAVEAK